MGDKKKMMIDNLIVNIIDWIKAIGIAIVIYFLINIFVSIETVAGASMADTLGDGDRLILTKLNEVEKGDIVSFDSELLISESDLSKLNPLQKLFYSEGDTKKLIKRIIAEAGDTISMDNGIVTVNGEIIDESYTSSIKGSSFDEITVPEGKVFVMGDNRANSHDSRSEDVGFVDVEKIIGSVWIRIYPLNAFGDVDK